MQNLQIKLLFTNKARAGTIRATPQLAIPKELNRTSFLGLVFLE